MASDVFALGFEQEPSLSKVYNLLQNIVLLRLRKIQWLNLRWFLSIALRTPTAHDFYIISARKLARARTQRNKFSLKLSSIAKQMFVFF